MATIKERAKNLDTGRYEDLALEASSSYEFGYMVGATEQRAVDIKKAIGWIDNYCLSMLSMETFRKFMEDE